MMNTAIQISEVKQDTDFPLTDDQLDEIACELENRITTAFEYLDVDYDDERIEHFLTWLEWQCKQFVEFGLEDTVDRYQAIFRSFDPEDPGKEQRLRHQLKTDGYALRKSRVRNTQSPEYGLYWIIDPAMNIPVAHGDNADGGMTLFEVEEWLNTPVQAAH